eukprot:1209962-Rhodomonas_salina.1
MRVLGEQEGRTVVPLIDMVLNTCVAKTSDASIATSSKLAGMQCLMDMWERHTILCASRILEVWSLSKQLVKSSDLPQVRLAALRTLACALSHSGSSGRSICEDVLKLTKPVLSEKLSCLRLAAAEVVLAAAK